MPTLAEAQSLLANYAGNLNSFPARLNLVRERLLQQGNWMGTFEPVALDIHADAKGNNIVTLPRRYATLLAGGIENVSTICPGVVMTIQNLWSEFNRSGLGYNANLRHFQEVAGYFANYQDWTSASKLRFKMEATESAGVIYVYGTLSGAEVWNSNAGTHENREAVSLNGASNVTSTNKFDSARLRITKPTTLGRVSAYSVADDGTETLVAVYDTDETLPRWKRYKVPYCTPPTGYSYIGIAKLAYAPVTRDADEVIPGNIAALKYGLDALVSEDARDYATATGLWEQSRAVLAEQVENETGAGAEGMVEIADDLEMCRVGTGL